jgi:hypothetical protein
MITKHLQRCVPGLLLLLSAGSPAVAEEDATRAVFQSIEAAWGRADARSVLRHFGERKVSISLPETDRAGGRFSRNQGYFILKKHFEATQILQFQFVELRHPSDAQRLAAALALRRYRERGDGRVIQDWVLVTLVSEEERWVVSEIKALP